MCSDRLDCALIERQGVLFYQHYSGPDFLPLHLFHLIILDESYGQLHSRLYTRIITFKLHFLWNPRSSLSDLEQDYKEVFYCYRAIRTSRVRLYSALVGSSGEKLPVFAQTDKHLNQSCTQLSGLLTRTYGKLHSTRRAAQRAATNNYFHYPIICQLFSLIVWSLNFVNLKFYSTNGPKPQNIQFTVK